MAELSILKIAFDKGYEGFKIDAPNPYQNNSLPYKEYIRGYNRGYFEQQKSNTLAGV